MEHYVQKRYDPVMNGVYDNTNVHNITKCKPNKTGPEKRR